MTKRERNMRVHVQNGESERKKEGIPRSPISEQKYRLHPLGQSKRPSADPPNRGEERINQKCSALQEDVQNGQAFKEQKCPTCTSLPNSRVDLEVKRIPRNSHKSKVTGNQAVWQLQRSTKPMISLAGCHIPWSSKELLSSS